ncbi:Mu transposase C-terminal domain-containing protein [Paenibacillus allorhizosphaerae]|uniref:Integrase catalytic domain-containing protein n=1 Tax=Paenibacillus allorhizosphaerae TaxID=2849866 RepID=A0ABN7TRN3_9BACL|nr:Mu transposase C-terminal domain-containing protein [Paenibacillus allorhizosphaerae]CAG7648090.1 hypothetical protein PAECIP111802_04120 [Paenibacillus allorhizosphaerae]
MQVLTVNQVLQWTPFEDNNSKFERILYISPDQDYLYVINLNAEDFPVMRLVEDVSTAILSEEARVVNFSTEVEKFSYESLPDDRKEEIDEAWNAIKELVENEPYIYVSDYRGPMVTDCMNKTGFSMPRVHRCLKKYWRSGKIKIGLLNHYHNCGGRGSDKVATNLTAKRGRKRKITRLEPEKVGINTDDYVLKKFKFAYRKYHLRENLSLRESFKKMLRTFFISLYEEGNGRIKPVLLPREQRPEFKTFCYYVNKFKNSNFIGDSLALVGERRFNLELRAKIGNQTKAALAPGSVFHIDATIADIYLTSSYREFLPIGRPVIYSVIDLFSHFIVGLYIGFEGPSYLGAAMAIYNTGSSKVEYCRKLGIPIAEEDWPAVYLPRQFTADRGEMLTKKNTGLRNLLGVDIEYMAPYRADWKALVESFFNVYKVGAISRLPGEVSMEMRRRGDPDPRTKAVLTLREFSEIMIDLAIWHNNDHWMKGYELDEHMIAEGIKPIPRDLWLWGMKRRGHCLRTFQEDVLKINLLPTETGRITNLGIKFKGIHYKCDQAIREGWFVDGNPRMGQQLNIAYDPRFTDKVILKGENGIGYQELVMIDPDHNAKEKTWDEFLHILEVIDLEHEVYKEAEEQAEAVKGYNRDKITETAKLIKQAAGSNHSKPINGIAERKAMEKELNRAKEHFFYNNPNEEVSFDDNEINGDNVVLSETSINKQEASEEKAIGNARLMALLSEQAMKSS